jgi:hypothetical protein
MVLIPHGVDHVIHQVFHRTPAAHHGLADVRPEGVATV